MFNLDVSCLQTVKHAEEIHGDEEQGTSVLTMNLLPPGEFKGLFLSQIQ